jgi:hypothetical protein
VTSARCGPQFLVVAAAMPHMAWSQPKHPTSITTPRLARPSNVAASWFFRYSMLYVVSQGSGEFMGTLCQGSDYVTPLLFV